MKLRKIVLAFLGVLGASVGYGEITTAAELNALDLRNTAYRGVVQLSGEVVARMGADRRILFRDQTGSVPIIYDTTSPTNALPRPGDRVAICGYAILLQGRENDIWAVAKSTQVIGRAEPQQPAAATAADVANGRCNLRLVRVSGTIIDAFKDEIASEWSYLLLKDAGETITVVVPTGKVLRPPFATIKDAEVSVVGVVLPHISGGRPYTGPYLEAEDESAVTVTAPPPADPFAIRRLEDFKHLAPRDFATLGRRRVDGRVLAVWATNRFLIDCSDKHPILAETAKGSPLPACGRLVNVIGHPATDLFNIKLTQAQFRYDDASPVPKIAAAVPCTVEQLTKDETGNDAMQHPWRGRAIRLRGIVRSLPAPGLPDARLNLECGDRLVPVYPGADPHAADRAQIGAVVDVSGICVMESSNWSPSEIFPRLDDFFLVMRSADDLAVVRSPPWWTPARVWTVLGGLLAALAAIFVWGLALRRLAERRGRQLFDEQVARIGSELRIDERTRLAVELHDSISQNLTGVALEVSTASRSLDIDLPGARRHLDLAEKTLKSCRNELRNCLWDLRNDALGDTDMNTAIRRTLAPQIGDIDLAVRFNVPRERLSDKTAHAILRIVRELAVNAVRHGQATALKVAGSIEGGTFLFSVRDNGCGFDPATACGTREGHFGLQGIRERVENFDGSLDIDSRLGKGTKVTVSLHLPTDNSKEILS